MLNIKELVDEKQGRMYESPQNPNECPLAAWDLYMDKIANHRVLFPKPCLHFDKIGTWYTQSKTVGKNTFDNLMKHLSLKCSLTQNYTNHCIRVTVVSVLKLHNISNTDISLITGHKNPQSIEKYNKKRKDGVVEELSNILHLESFI